jgi:hypothetical protein
VTIQRGVACPRREIFKFNKGKQLSIDDREYMRDRNRSSSHESRRFQTSEQKKERRAHALKIRFAKYLGMPHGIAVTLPWKRLLLIALVLGVGTPLLTRLPQLSSRFLAGHETVRFPATGAVRWFIPVAVNRTGDVAPLTITGLVGVGQNMVVRLDSWEARTPIVMIPVRGGETAALQVPVGRYRISYASDATWQGEFKLLGETQEGVEPLAFYRTENQVLGHRIDLNGRINGNLKTRRTSYF